MQYQTHSYLGKKVSRIGFGCFLTGGHGWGRVDERDSIRTLRIANESGINFFDTADVYGLGHSEKILRQVFGSRLKELVVSTKGGIRVCPQTKRSYADCSDKWLRQALEASLKRLKLETIDIYTLHRFDQSTPIEETLATLEAFRKEGKIRAASISNFPHKVAKDLASNPLITSMQYEYSMLKQEEALDILELCKAHNLSFFAYSPLMQGLLTGKFSSASRFSDDDARSRHPNFDKKFIELKVHCIDRLSEIAKQEQVSMSQLALSWLLEQSTVSSIILGARTPQQLIENLQSLIVKINSKNKVMVSSILANYSHKSLAANEALRC